MIIQQRKSNKIINKIKKIYKYSYGLSNKSRKNIFKIYQINQIINLYKL